MAKCRLWLWLWTDHEDPGGVSAEGELLVKWFHGEILLWTKEGPAHRQDMAL